MKVGIVYWGLVFSIMVSLICFFLIRLVQIMEEDFIPEYADCSKAEYERTKRLHKFHGIGMSVYVEDGIYGSWVDKQGGEWFLNKEGKVCSLWDPNERR